MKTNEVNIITSDDNGVIKVDKKFFILGVFKHSSKEEVNREIISFRSTGGKTEGNTKNLYLLGGKNEALRLCRNASPHLAQSHECTLLVNDLPTKVDVLILPID